jgi:hypothetical protein
MAERAIDVTLVAGRRPDLLGRTLASFSEGLFRHFRIADVHANIDPVFGDAAEGRACREAILKHFPQATIHEPEDACFGGAVKRVWGETTSDLVFHLEDDWLLNAPVTPRDIEPLLVGRTRAVVLIAQVHGWNGRDQFNTRRRKTRLFGVTLRQREVDVFSTSPQFIDGAFARRAAELMDPDLDPEKQMRPPHNPALRAFVDEYRCRLLPSPTGGEMLIDIGRPWREARNIRKIVAEGVSTWTASD